MNCLKNTPALSHDQDFKKGSNKWLMYSFFLNPLKTVEGHSCILMMNKMSLAVTQLHRLLVYIEMQTDL